MSMSIAPGLLSIAAATFPALKTFGTGKSAFTLGSAESTVFEYALSADSAPDAFGVMTHFWITGSPATSTDNATIRYYVDGETTPSVEFKPPMAAGVGFDDAQPNWGTSKIGRGSDLGGWFVNIKIPFGRSVRTTIALASGSKPAMAYVILRGCENMPIGVGALQLPPSARLRLHKIEGETFAPFAFVPVVDLPTGRGLIYMHAIAASSLSYNFWEGCYRLFTPHEQPFPGTVLSTGMEDYFDSAYGFHAGAFHLPVSGCTHRKVGAWRGDSGGHADGGVNATRSLEVSAYRFHEEDPLFFDGGVRMSWRVGDYSNPHTHPESPKCYINAPGPGDKPVGTVLNTTVTSYAWVYTW